LLIVLQNSVQNGPNWCESSSHEVASEFFATNTFRLTPLGPKLMFRCIWYYLVALQNLVQNEPMWCKSSCNEVVSEFFETNTPDPPHSTLISCFGAFHTIWVHLG